MNMEKQPLVSKYKTLHERGVVLDDKKIDIIVERLTEGIRNVYDYLQIKAEDRNLGFISSENLDRIGYAITQRAVNIPIAYLNSISSTTPLNKIQVTIGVINKKIDYLQYLVNAGREEAIHHFQCVGHPTLHAAPSDLDKYMRANEVEKLLCDFEVEARKIVDLIAEKLGEPAVNKELDDFLKKTYPDKYNKPL